MTARIPLTLQAEAVRSSRSYFHRSGNTNGQAASRAAESTLLLLAKHESRARELLSACIVAGKDPVAEELLTLFPGAGVAILRPDTSDTADTLTDPDQPPQED